MEIDMKMMLGLDDNFKKYSNVKSVLIQGGYKKQQPQFSIVIPTYRRISTLKVTLESALNQDSKDYYDIIICDNNPQRNDETESFISSVKDDRVIYYKNLENIGMVGNWNRCIELCDGNFMIMIHDDDILSPYFISNSKKILKRYSKIDILYPLRINWWQNKNEAKPIFLQYTKFRLYKLNVIDYLLGNSDPPTGVLLRKSAMIQLGGYSEYAYPSSDYYFNVKAVLNINVYRCLSYFSIYRWESNTSMKQKTLDGFREKDIPLILFILQKLHVPNFIGNVILKLYNIRSINYIKEFCPNSSQNINDHNLPLNSHYIKIYQIIENQIRYLIRLKNRLWSISI